MEFDEVDLVDWISNRRDAIINAWASEPELSVFEDDLVGHISEVLYESMLDVLLGNGDERDFMGRVAINSNVLIEKVFGLRFYNVTLKLARAATRSEREKRVAAAFPYRRTSILEDSRSHPGHSALVGILLRRDHPFWRRWHPPLEMDCRCNTIVMTQRQFERGNFEITSEATLIEKESRLVGSWLSAFEPLLDFRR